MNKIKTDKFTLEAVEDSYLKLSIFASNEIVKEDIPDVLEFMDQFSSPAPVLLIRESVYSLSVMVQISLFLEAKRRICAIAYIDRNHKETVLTKIAKNTYFKDAKVRSFRSEADAIAWLEPFGPLCRKNAL